jgi:hypothetical protein
MGISRKEKEMKVEIETGSRMLKEIEGVKGE